VTVGKKPVQMTRDIITSDVIHIHDEGEVLDLVVQKRRNNAALYPG
jgi:hypothetical protein